jgi:hypothetical protein
MADILSEYLESNTLRDLATRYVDHYEELKEIESELKRQKEMIDDIKEELYSEMDMAGIKTIDEGRVMVTKSQRTFPKVVDYHKLQNYITETLNEPISEYTKLEFISAKLTELIKTAQADSIKDHVPLEDVMPDGLEIATTKIITVRGKGDRDG